MESLGKAIPVTGPDKLFEKEQVWFSELRVFKVLENGKVNYQIHVLHPTVPGTIDTIVRKGLDEIGTKLSAL